MLADHSTGKKLEAKLTDLHDRLNGRCYVAPPIRRVWIDKEGGKKRPIGITEFEDKIVQPSGAKGVHRGERPTCGGYIIYNFPKTTTGT